MTSPSIDVTEATATEGTITMTEQPLIVTPDRDDADRPRLHAVPATDTAAVNPAEAAAPGEEQATSLRAGDALADVDALTAPSVDGHLVQLPRPSLGEQLRSVQDGERVPVLPGWARDRRVLREKTARTARAVGYVTGFRTVRAPWDAVRLSWYATVGARRLGWRLTRWVFDIDGHPLLGEVTARDDRAYVRMAHDRTVRQKWRFTLVALAALLLLAGLAMVNAYSPWWVLPALAVLTVATLARHGKPAGVQLLSPAVRRDVRIPLTSQAIVQALSVLGISPLTKALATDSSRIWRSGIVDVRGGHRVQIQLPLGVLAVDLVPHEQRMAHALGRRADCVIVEPLPDRTPGDLVLHILDKPVLATGRGAGPLAKARKASWWTPVQVGITRIGSPHSISLRGGAWFLGGQPSSGKSSLLKIAAAHTALDPHAVLSVLNLKGSPDYVGVKPVCHRYLSGSPETDPLVIGRAVDLLRELLAETARRNDYLTRLVEAGKAESTDVTPDLAAAHKTLRPYTVVIDEAHRLFDKTDNPDAEETADLLGKVIKACRSVGITLVCATQLAGTESVPPALVRAARIRGCLTVQDEISFRQIFGNAGRGAYADSGVAALPPGTVILKSEDGAAVKVGTYLIDTKTLTDIGRRALALRSDLQLLSGDAIGDTLTPTQPSDPADLLRAVLAAIPTTAPTGGRDDDGVAWLTELEAALTGKAEYADRASGWLATELRARNVPTAGLNRRVTGEDGQTTQRNTAGVRATAVRQALEHLLTTQPNHPDDHIV
jgi:S-DNA-T family DNA segregation ATPase FtsK/SpoIIIE